MNYLLAIKEFISENLLTRLFRFTGSIFLVSDLGLAKKFQICNVSSSPADATNETVNRLTNLFQHVV